jgi:hypothetical protein
MSSDSFLCVCVCGRANSHSAWEGPKEPCPGPPEAQGPPSTRNVFQDRPPSSVSKCCAVFSPNRRGFLCRGPVRRWTELYARLQCHFASCDWPRCADESHSNRDGSHASTSAGVVGVSPANPIFECGSSCSEMPLLLVASFQCNCWLALFSSTPANAQTNRLQVATLLICQNVRGGLELRLDHRPCRFRLPGLIH